MDHARVNIHSTNMSCGVFELSRISSETEEVLYAIATRLYHPARGDPVAFILWSDVAGDTNSQKLEDLIYALDLGKVGSSSILDNPRTGNLIYVAFWEVDHESFKKWYSQYRVSRLKKVGT